jgi:hypothetical protein
MTSLADGVVDGSPLAKRVIDRLDRTTLAENVARLCPVNADEPFDDGRARREVGSRTSVRAHRPSNPYRRRERSVSGRRRAGDERCQTHLREG